MHGFKLVQQWTDGPMGSWKFLFSDGVADIAVFNDRGDKGVGVGARDGATFGIYVWLELLGMDSAEPSSGDDQLSWVFQHATEIRDAIQADANMERTLTRVNWTFLKEGLGLRPDADPDDPSTWDGP